MPVSSQDPQFSCALLENQAHINCGFEYYPQNTDFVQAVTNGLCSGVSDAHSTLEFTNTTSTNVYASFDHALQNLPSELYVQKLLEITSNNEQLIKEYRYALLVNAKTIQGCLTGKLMTRKTTKVAQVPLDTQETVLLFICSAMAIFRMCLMCLINQNQIIIMSFRFNRLSNFVRLLKR